MFGSYQTFLNLSFYAILPAALILLYVYKRDKLPEPPRIVFITLLLGAGISFPLSILIFVFEGFLETLNFGTEANHFYMSFIRAAFLEEMMKYLVLVFYCLYLDVFDEPMDALVYGVAASLGFAVLENWEYVINASREGTEIAKQVAYIRAFTAVPLHALTGVFMGFFLMDAVFKKYDIVILPTQLEAPPPWEESTGDPLFNEQLTFSGHPAVTLPMGSGADNMPLGIQLGGRRFGESDLLAAARWCEEELGWRSEIAEPIG